MGKQIATGETKSCRPVADGQGAKREGWLAKPLTLVLIHDLRPLPASVSLSLTHTTISLLPQYSSYRTLFRTHLPWWEGSVSCLGLLCLLTAPNALVFSPQAWREIFVLPSLDLEHASSGPATWKVCPGCLVNDRVSQSIRLL